MTKIHKNRIFMAVLLTCVAACSLCFALSIGNGCSCANILEEKEIANYLHGKYSEDFTFIRNGDESWNSTYSLWRYANSSGSEFYVKVDKKSGDITDSYQSVKYDNSLANHINEILDNQCIVSVNTKSCYFDKNETFNNFVDYMKRCVGITINIYSRENFLSSSDINKLTHFSDNPYTIWNAALSSFKFDEYKGMTDPVIDSGFINGSDYSRNYSVENGVATLR